MRSKNENAVEQGCLIPAGEPVVVPMESILAQRSLLGAINLCITSCGAEDKEVYIPLGIDPGHFTNLKKGNGHFPTERINDLMTLCGNEAPLIWLAHQRGYGLVVLKTEAERRAEQAERRAEIAEMKVRVLTEAIGGRAAA